MGYLDFSSRLDEDPRWARRTSSEVLLLTREDLQGPYRALRPALRTRKVAASGLVLFDCLNCGAAQEPRESRRASPDTRAFAKVDGRLSATPKSATNGGKHLRDLGAGVLDKNARVTAILNGDDGGTVVLTNTFYPGWRAFVDEFEEEVFRADSLFMGVDTPKGSRAIVFSYEPEPVYWGRIVSTGAGILVLLGLGNLFYFRLHDSYFRT